METISQIYVHRFLKIYLNIRGANAIELLQQIQGHRVHAWDKEDTRSSRGAC